MSFEEGSLVEPLSVALAGIDRSGLRLADPLVICGAGPIGLTSLLAANAAGAEPIVITDLDEGRLSKAKDLVPRVRTVLVEKGQDAKAVSDKIVRGLGQLAKLVLECTGVESSIHSAIYVSEKLLLCTSDTALPRRANSDFAIGHAFWWCGLCYRSWKRFSEYSIHALICKRDRPEVSVPVS